MAQEFSDITAAFAAYACSIHEERFYDAHEDLEQLWFPRRFEDNDEVKLWKGFINAAVSFELIKRGRPSPSEVAWKTYLKYRPLLESLVTPHKELYGKMMELIEKKHQVLFFPSFP
ncbi:DUF309 domain-containing protein [Sulfuricurvum sp.]|uniref:DUF309 domain-containing protein n=1 Tax=Sulfuricurvum sp. TaxID=2025608 RepID=UPI003C439DE4